MSKLTYTIEGNQICLSNGIKEKHLEWIHEGLLRVYEEKNREELVHLTYRNELVASKIVALGENLIIKSGNNEILVDDSLTLRLILRNIQGKTLKSMRKTRTLILQSWRDIRRRLRWQILRHR